MIKQCLQLGEEARWRRLTPLLYEAAGAPLLAADFRGSGRDCTLGGCPEFA